MTSIPSRQGILLCLVGPAGAGKNTIGDMLLEKFGGSIRRGVTVTTRHPRPGEIEGISYYFVSREDFLLREKQGDFFEWEEIHGNYYGTPRSSLEQVQQEGTDLLLTIDIRGALTFKTHYPDNAIIVFLVPPSRDAMVERLRGRGGNEEDLQTRLKTASEEYDTLLQAGAEVDYFVVNDRADETYITLSSILRAERARLRRVDRSYIERICR